jgi:hypothetical protein
MLPTFTRLEIAGYVVEAITALLAVRLATLRVYHRPFAALASYIIVSDVLRACLRLFYPYAAHGLFGRGAMVLDPLLFVGEPLGFVIAAAALWAPRWREASWGAAVIAAAALGLIWSRGFPAEVLWWVELGAQGAAWGCFLAHLCGGGRWGGSPTRIALGIYGGGRLAIFLGPYLDGGPTPEGWPPTWGITTGTQLALIALHLSWLAEGLSPTPSSGSSPRDSSTS